nr:hypothetical protein [uncultured Capnocytophaga sp.]
MFAKTTYAFNSGKVGKRVVFRYCAGKTLVGSFPIRRSPKAQPTAKQQTIGSTLIVQATDLPKNVTEKQQTL